MALAKGVTESFGKGFLRGSDIVSSALKSKKEKQEKEKERLDNLVRYNPQAMTPLAYQKALDEIQERGTFSYNPTEESTFGKSGKDDTVVVDTVLVAAYPDLVPYLGTEIPKTNLIEMTKGARANTIATGQANRQNVAISEGKRKESQSFRQSQARSAYVEFLKAKQSGTEDEVREEVANAFKLAGYPEEEIERFRSKQMPQQEEQGWLSKLFGKVKSSAQKVMEKSKTISTTDQETSTRRRNPQTDKWWVFKDGKWQPE